MYNNNNSNNQIPLELYFSELEQFSVLRLLFFNLNDTLSKKELEKFSKVEKLLLDLNWGLKKNEIIVFKYFIENPNTTLYGIKKTQNLKQEKLENLYRYKDKLLEKKLLTEKIDKENNKICQVSDIGIFYLLLTEQTFNTQIQKKLLVNYNDFVIFKVFVYPYISYDSILKINDHIVFSNIFVYLKKCCEKVMYALSYVDPTTGPYNRYLKQQLFFWKKPAIDDINEGNLKFFLTYHLKLPWVYNAEIKKDPQDKYIIRIDDKSSSNKAIIRLLENKSKANLIVNGKKRYDGFVVRKLKDNYYSIEDFEYSIDSSDSRITVKESSLKNLIIFIQQDVQVLIFSILLSYGTNMKHPVYEILKKDKMFMQSLEKTKHYFNQRYRDIKE